MNMKKKSDRAASKAGSVIRTLLAGLLLCSSAASWAATPTEIPTELDPADLELTPQWPDTGLNFEDPEFTDFPIALADEAWSVSDRPAGRFARPVNKLANVCGDCEIHLGVGGTYHSFEGTGGVVIPLTVSWDRSRWEFGLFHFSEQSSDDNALNTERLVARPYWGTSLSRRFQLFERGPLRAIFGFGVSYRTETDILSATRFNFSSQFGLRFQSPSFPAIFELSARHWSNGGIKTPNRGQDFTILTVRFDR
jgi:hypothetical protein